MRRTVRNIILDGSMVFSFSEVVATDRFTERFSLDRKGEVVIP